MSVDPRIQEAIRFIKSGNKALARPILRDLLVEHPYNANLWYLAAMAAETQQDYIAFLNRTVQLEPKHPQANFALAKLNIPRRSVRSAATPVRTQRQYQPTTTHVVIALLSSIILCAIVTAPRSSKNSSPTAAPSAVAEIAVRPNKSATPTRTKPTATEMAIASIRISRGMKHPVHSGPAEFYTILGQVWLGEEIPLTGRTKIDGWVAISYKGKQGWVYLKSKNAEIDIRGDFSKVPVVLIANATFAPPTSYPSPTAYSTSIPIISPPIYKPIGRTRCRDGTYSNSTGRGTCSHHGGIDR